MNNISKGSVWKDTLNTCSTLPFLYCGHYCDYFHIQEKSIPSWRTTILNGYWENVRQETWYFQNQEFWVIHSQFRAAHLCKNWQWLWVQPAPELPHTLECIHHAPQGDGPAQRGGRRVGFASSRPELLQEVHMSESEMRLWEVWEVWEVCMNTYNILLLLVAQKFTDSIMLSRMASPCPTLDWQTPFSNLKKYRVWFEEVPLADCSPLPAFCPFHLLSQALHSAAYKP